MNGFAVILALLASLAWACASVFAFNPVKHFGTFNFVRIQLPTSALLLIIVVTGLGTWDTVDWSYWPYLLTSALIGILLGDLALMKCLQHGGPRRMHILFALNAPIVAVLGYVIFSEALSTKVTIGFVLILSGVIAAIWFTPTDNSDDSLEKLDGNIWMTVLWGLIAALCQAIGLLAMKPVFNANIDPLAGSAIRTSIGAALILLTFILPKYRSIPNLMNDMRVAGQTIFAGWLGYVVAMSLLLVALSLGKTGLVAVLGSTVPVMMILVIWITTKKMPSGMTWLSAMIVVSGTALIIQ